MSAPITSIDSVVAQMRQIAMMASAPAAIAGDSHASPVSPGGFAAELKSAMQNVSAAQQQSGVQAQHFQLGKPGVSLNDVMIDMQKASIGFQSLVQVRNKLVSAYQTIASMPL